MNVQLGRVLVFVTAACVLILEILAGRLLAPYVGISLEVFTGIIGVILAGIAVGAWVGGRMADRTDPGRLLGPILVLGGSLALVTPLIVDSVGPAVSTDPISIVFVTFAGFFGPAAVLSAIHPIVVKAVLPSVEEAGTVVGSFSAIGTAGALVGTFLAGFWLIAQFPGRTVVSAIGVVLALVGLVLWVTLPGKGRVAVGALILLVGAAGIASDGPCEYETKYHCVNILVDAGRPSGRTLFMDLGHHSYVDLDDPSHLEFRYIKVMADVIELALPPGSLSVVSIGGGGFTMAGYLAAIRPGTQHLVLEIDPHLEDIGRERLGFSDSAEIIADDARRSLKDVGDHSVDLVVGDAFSGFSVPWHLTTQEFLETVDSKLADGGLYILNVIDYGPLDFVRSEVKTLQAVFPEVVVIAPPSYLAGESGGNFVLAGSMSPIDSLSIQAKLRSRGSMEVVARGEMLDTFIGDAVVLTDDFAPVDQLMSLPGLG